jgi:hypothetical protein
MNAERETLLIPVAGGDGTNVTGEAVLREWARLSADYLTMRLADVAEHDPLRGEIEALASRYVALTGPTVLQPSA